MKIENPFVISALAIVAIGACGGGSPDDPAAGNLGTVQLAVASGSAFDVSHIEFRVHEVSSGLGCGDVSALDSVVPLEDELAPSLGQIDGHRFANEMYVLPPGDYLACATPLQNDSPRTASAECGVASRTFTVTAGITILAELLSPCDGNLTGGLDIVAGLGDPPTIADVDVQPSKFITACQSATIDASATAADGTPVTQFDWAVTSMPTGASVTLPASGDPVTFSADLVGQYDIEVTATDVSGGEGKLVFPIHVSPCADELLIGKAGGGNSNDSATGVATDSAGDIVVGGRSSSSTIDLGDGALTGDGFVAKYDSGGTIIWSRSLDGKVNDVAINAMDEIFVVGSHNGVLAPAGACPSLPDPLQSSGFVMKLSTTGVCEWLIGLNDASGTATVNKMVVTAIGNDVVAAGSASDEDIVVPGTSQTLVDADLFYLKRSGVDGSHMWAKRVTSNGFLTVGALAHRGNAIALAGYVQAASSVTFDPGVSTAPTAALPLPFVGVLDDGAAGDAVWVAGLTSATSTSVAFADGIAFLPSGDVVASGRFLGDISFGADVLLSGTSVDPWVTRYSAAGAAQWSIKSQVSTGSADFVRVGAAADGTIRLAGRFTNDIGFGGSVISAAAANDVFVVGLSGTGNELWTRHVTSPSSLQLGDFATDSLGSTYIAGTYGNGAMTLGALSLPFTNSADPFIAKLAP